MARASGAQNLGGLGKSKGTEGTAGNLHCTAAQAMLRKSQPAHYKLLRIHRLCAASICSTLKMITALFGSNFEGDYWGEDSP